ncbi:NmrA-like protein [Xylariales sp. PMI_506]|nr:NmrA-like protein [Xylariales sp. PMI_506]
MASPPFVAVAGATGTMGKLITTELRKRNVAVKALVRPGTTKARTESLSQLGGVTVAEVDVADTPALVRELTGAICVVSSLQGLADVILKAQGQLLDAAVAAKVPRFIPSDFSLDFTKTKPGSNRNLDLRREFHPVLERSGIAWTSILNGAFMDLLVSEMSLVDRKKRKVVYVGNANQKLDFTTMADTAAYTAAVAADPNPTPKFLRIAGDVLSANELAACAARADGKDGGKPFSVSWIGSQRVFEFMISAMRRILGGEDKLMPPWQGMQYMANMFSGLGKLDPINNNRYPEIRWTKVEDFLRNHYASETQSGKK